MISLWIENINQIGNFTFLNSKNGICCSVACNEFPSHRTFATRVAVLSTWSLLSIHFLLLWSIKQQAFHQFRLQCKIFIENRILNASIASRDSSVCSFDYYFDGQVLSKLSNFIQVAQIVQLCPKLANSVQMEFFWKFISRLDWRFQSCFHSMNVFRGNCLSNNICFLSYISVNYTALLYFQMYPQKHVPQKRTYDWFLSGFIDTEETTKKVWMITFILIADVSSEQIHVSIPKYICVVCIASLFV